LIYEAGDICANFEKTIHIRNNYGQKTLVPI